MTVPDRFIEPRNKIDFIRCGSYYVGVCEYNFLPAVREIDVGLTGMIRLSQYAYEDEIIYGFCLYVDPSFDNRFVHGGI